MQLAQVDTCKVGSDPVFVICGVGFVGAGIVGLSMPLLGVFMCVCVLLAWEFLDWLLGLA